MDLKNINNGDIIAVALTGPIWTIVKAVQGLGGLGNNAKYVHVGVAVWLNDVCYCAEMDGSSNSLVPVMRFINAKQEVAVFDSGVGSDKMMSLFSSQINAPISYAWLDFINIFLRLVFGLNTDSVDNKTNEICSTFVTRWLQAAGWQAPVGFPRVSCPGEVCKALGNPKLTILDT